MENRVIAISIIDKYNELIYFWSDDGLADIIHLQTVFFCSLDVVEEKHKS
jgi:hypothetical protein